MRQFGVVSASAFVLALIADFTALPGALLDLEPRSQKQKGELMTRKIIFTPEAPKPPAVYSQAVKACGLVFHFPGRRRSSGDRGFCRSYDSGTNTAC